MLNERSSKGIFTKSEQTESSWEAASCPAHPEPHSSEAVTSASSRCHQSVPPCCWVCSWVRAERSAVLALLTLMRPSEALILVLFPAASCFHLYGFQNRYQRP